MVGASADSLELCPLLASTSTQIMAAGQPLFRVKAGRRNTFYYYYVYLRSHALRRLKYGVACIGPKSLIDHVQRGEFAQLLGLRAAAA